MAVKSGSKTKKVIRPSNKIINNKNNIMNIIFKDINDLRQDRRFDIDEIDIKSGGIHKVDLRK